MVDVLRSIGNDIKEVAVIVSTVMAALMAVAVPLYRYVLLPRVIRPRRQRNERVDAAMGKIDTMAAALGPNGGKSLSDLIHKTAAAAERTEQTTSLLAAAVALNDIRTAEITDLMTNLLLEFCDEGLNIRASEAFCRQFGYTPNELLNHGWKNVIHEDDRARMIREFDFAVRERRAFSSVGRFVSKSGGVVLNGHMTANPRFDVNGTLILFTSRVEILKQVAA